MAYEVPALPYDFGALEPHIDAKTMEIHHDKHHQAYVDKVNAALEGTDFDGKPIEEVLKNLDAFIGLLLALIVNETFRWRGLARATVFAPWVVSGVLTTVLWTLLYSPTTGFLRFLSDLGIGSPGTAVLADPDTVFGAAVGESNRCRRTLWAVGAQSARLGVRPAYVGPRVASVAREYTSSSTPGICTPVAASSIGTAAVRMITRMICTTAMPATSALRSLASMITCDSAPGLPANSAEVRSQPWIVCR